MTTPFPPVEPAATDVDFPSAEDADENGVVAAGPDFRCGTILTAYRNGIFPWPHDVSIPGLRGLSSRKVVLWCSPEERAVLDLKHPLHWSRSLRRTLRRCDLRVTLNQAFEQVMRACGDARPSGTWIIEPMVRGYCELRKLGHAHSVEVWEGHELVGGIYGIAVGGVFSGESMFHSRTDASKVAFAWLAESLRSSGFSTLDAQVQNPHLESLGCVEMPRQEFVRLLRGDRALRRLTLARPSV